MSQLFETEETPEGTQTLVPGVKQTTEREKLEKRMSGPLRGSSAPCDRGLFDDGARAQLDMLDLI